MALRLRRTAVDRAAERGRRGRQDALRFVGVLGECVGNTGRHMHQRTLRLGGAVLDRVAEAGGRGLEDAVRLRRAAFDGARDVRRQRHELALGIGRLLGDQAGDAGGRGGEHALRFGRALPDRARHMRGQVGGGAFDLGCALLHRVGQRGRQAGQGRRASAALCATDAATSVDSVVTVRSSVGGHCHELARGFLTHFIQRALHLGSAAPDRIGNAGSERAQCLLRLRHSGAERLHRRGGDVLEIGDAHGEPFGSGPAARLDLARYRFGAADQQRLEPVDAGVEVVGDVVGAGAQRAVDFLGLLAISVAFSPSTSTRRLARVPSV